MSLRIPAFLTAAALLFSACGGGDAGTPVTSPAYLSFRDQPTACGAERPETAVEMVFEEPDDLGLTGVIEVALDTSCGDITLALYADIAPITVNSFVFLAEQGYYDGTALHRVVPGFMAQFGDPSAGGGGVGAPGYFLPDELPPADYVYPQGALAMANAGANTAGSQFFITVREVALPPLYSVFGQVLGGFDTLNKMTAIPLGDNPNFGEVSKPLETIYINHIEVVGR